MTVKFLRVGARRFIRFGKGRKKKQKYRRAKGRHSKVREKRKTRTGMVEIGFRTPKAERGKIKNKKVIFVRNFSDLKNVGKNDLVIIASVGKKKRKLIEQEIEKKEAKILNLRKEKNEIR